MTTTTVDTTKKSKETDEALDKIFLSITEALKQNRNDNVTLDNVDKTIESLFLAINDAQIKGKKVEIPDFNSILSGE